MVSVFELVFKKTWLVLEFSLNPSHSAETHSSEKNSSPQSESNIITAQLKEFQTSADTQG